jgi:hypothetical protein
VKGEKGELTGWFAGDAEEKKQKRADAGYMLPKCAQSASLITTTLVATARERLVYWGKNHGDTRVSMTTATLTMVRAMFPG